jgi:hypothetical protein
MAHADIGLVCERVDVAMPRLYGWHSLASRAKGLNGLIATRDTDMATSSPEQLCQWVRSVSEIGMEYQF